MRRNMVTTIAMAAGWLAACAAARAEGDAGQGGAALEALARALELPQQVMSGKVRTFALQLSVEIPPGEGGRRIVVALSRRGADEFSASASETPLGPLALVRAEGVTALVDQGHKRLFVGTGTLPTSDALEPGELARRLAEANGDLASLAGMALAAEDSRVLAMQMVGLMKLVERPREGTTLVLQSSEPVAGRVFTVRLVAEESRIASLEWSTPGAGGPAAGGSATGGQGLAPSGRILYSLTREAAIEPIPVQGYEKIEVDRAELERSLARGLPRGVEMLYRRDHPRRLRDGTRREAGGMLVVRDGRRICFLSGAPADLGAQHGKLLGREVRSTVDGVLYAHGLKESLASGRWMLDEWRKSLAARGPGDDDSAAEMRALAEAAGLTADEVRQANVAVDLRPAAALMVPGELASDGKAREATVFNAPAGFGSGEVLRDQAAVFVVRPRAGAAHAGPGYAGLVGLCGRMTADGAVAVAALVTHDDKSGPLKEFLQSRPAGGEKLGPEELIRLMSPPLAARGANLVNVLWEPAGAAFQVAVARGVSDAWQEPYVRYDLKALLQEAEAPAP